MGRSSSRSVATHLAAFLVGVVVAATFAADAVPSGRAERERYATLDAFAQALAHVSTSYVEEVGERRLIYGALRGMVEELDGHSAFLPPRSYQRLREDTGGEFGGVGVSLGEPPAGDESAYPVVEELIDGSPADRAGVRVGDRLVAVDGRSTIGKRRRSARVWDSRLRGRVGTRVEITLQRASGSEVTFDIVRARVKQPSVHHERLGSVGYIAIRRFQDATGADALAALEALKERSGGAVRALVLDLRGNPGGLLDQAVRVADLFIEGGAIVTVSGRGGATLEEHAARAPGTWSGFPMIVLIDQGSASAAEIVAGALQDHRRAQVLGVRSYGKGSVQTFLDLKDGSGLKLTTARYLTPSGQSLQTAGITPDIEVDATPAPEGKGRRGGLHRGGDTAAEDEPARSGAAGGGAGGKKGAKLDRRLRDDRQLRVAYQTLRGHLVSKKTKGK